MLWTSRFGLAGDIWEAAWNTHRGLPMEGGALSMTPEICCRGGVGGREQEFSGTCAMRPSEWAAARESLSRVVLGDRSCLVGAGKGEC